MRYIVKYFPEISIKSNPVRKQFVKRLRESLRSATKRIASGIQVTSHWDYLSVEALKLNELEQQELLDLLLRTPGIHSILRVQAFEFETLDDIVTYACEIYAQQLAHKTFVVRCKRTGNHDFTSHDAERYIGGGLLKHTEAAGVKMKGADVTVKIEIKKKQVFLVTDRYEGIGGFPVASLGSVLSLISGGYDSPVASYLTMRRGLATHYCFFNLGGKAHEVGVKEVAYHLWSRYGMNQKVMFYTVPFEGVIAELIENVSNAYMGVILKRMMLRAAEQVAQQMNLKALATGEAVAQVSSQTIVNLSCIDEVTKMLVLRPIVTMDKDDIIAHAKKIGTDVFAEHMPEYCGVISVKPTTKASMERIHSEEANFDMQVLQDAVSRVKQERIDRMKVEQSESVEEFAFPLADSVIVDVRHPDEVEMKPLVLDQKNTIINIPFYRLDKDFETLDHSRHYSLYCDKGVMSRLHGGLLLEQGYDNVAVYRPAMKKKQ